MALRRRVQKVKFLKTLWPHFGATIVSSPNVDDIDAWCATVGLALHTAVTGESGATKQMVRIPVLDVLVKVFLVHFSDTFDKDMAAIELRRRRHLWSSTSKAKHERKNKPTLAELRFRVSPSPSQLKACVDARHKKGKKKLISG